MFRKRKLTRIVALFFVMEIGMDMTFPYMVQALTSGPTAPEASSFEPVDTTDMVSLITGDFTYNLPLLEVPGPSGGYPLSLSYHAGIQPMEEASWVGLGWSLNPGSITRIVNGYADDHEGVSNAQRTFWEGGSTKTTSVGVSVGIANTATVSAGLSFSQDTYRGFGIGGYVGAGVGIGLGKDSPLGIGGSANLSFMDYDGDSEKGKVSAGVSVGISISQALAQDIGAGGFVGLNYNTQSGFGGGVSAGIIAQNAETNQSVSLMGASISTGGDGTSGSVGIGGGTASVNNAKSNNVSTHSSGFSVDIPTPIPAVNLRLSRHYTRYWIDQLETVSIYGGLYAPDFNSDKPVADFKNAAYDSYDLADLRLPNSKFKTSAKIFGGTFPDYDIYSVNAQGISGNIRPYHIQKAVYRQNLEYETGDVGGEYYNYSMPGRNWPVLFRFVGDFSNSYSAVSDNMTYNSTNKELTYNFEDIEYTEKVKGAKHIAYFTNEKIKENSISASGFIDGNSVGFERKTNSQIGGFQITNESGVTYHFSLPAYSKNEWTYSENTDDKQKKSFNSLEKADEYAYTWYLTGITGPDFVDRGTIGKLDDQDWGYWISFEYGLWTDMYGWRNPGTGFHKDLDTRFRGFSKGDKELYYLNYIRSKTHTAIFSKEIRNDSKGVVHDFDDNAVRTTTANAVESVDAGGFESVEKSMSCESSQVIATIHPRSTLKLNKIYLVANKDFSPAQREALLASDDTYQHAIDGTGCYFHYGNHVVDVHDVKQNFETTAVIRSIGFNTNYSLTTGMPNSFVSPIDVKNNTELQASSQRTGRLTLKSVSFNGKGEVNLVPPLNFRYGKNPVYQEGDWSDIWGFYKSDMNIALREKNENEGRAVTENSAQSVDAWSLTNITTSLGASINIDYESDDFRLPDEFKSFDFNIVGAEALNEDKVKITFDNELDPSEYFKVGEEIESIFLHRNHHSNYRWRCDTEPGDPNNEEGEILCSYEQGYDKVLNEWSTDDVRKFNSVIESATAEYIIVNDRQLSFTVDGFDTSGAISREHHRNILIADLRAGVISRAGQNTDVLGGGLRVKKINVKTLTDERSTLYDYTVTGYSSGVTSYEPTKVEKVLLNSEAVAIDGVNSIDNDGNPVETNFDHGALEFIKQVYTDRVSRILAISRDIPGPGVYYSQVKVSEEVKKSPSQTFSRLPAYSVYKFEVFHPGMIGTMKETDPKIYHETGTFYNNLSYQKVATQKVNLEDYTSRIGNLKSICLYDGNGKLLNETINHYLHDDIIRNDNNVPPTFNENVDQYETLVKNKFDGIGIQSETYINARYVRQGQDGLLDNLNENEHYLAGIVSERKHYPNIQIGQTSKNYKTGIITSSKTLAFDKYSGSPVKTLSKDGYGNYYVSETTPAYHKYPGMGLVMDGGVNMLIQEAETKTYKVEAPENLTPKGLVSASVQTWNDQMPLINYGKRSDPMTIRYVGNSTRSKIFDVVTPNVLFNVGDQLKFETDFVGIHFQGSVVKDLGNRRYEIVVPTVKVSGFYPKTIDFPNHPDQVVWFKSSPYKHRSYTFIGNDNLQKDGLYDYDTYNLNLFNTWHHDLEPTTSFWQKNSEITLYDAQSHALEASDVNGNQASTRFDSRQEHVVATVANAGYEEFMYSGAEDLALDDFIGMANETGKVSTDKAHTGIKSVKTTGNTSNGFKYNLTTKKSRRLALSVWSDNRNAALSYRIGEGTVVPLNVDLPIQQSGDWYMLKATLPAVPANSSIEVACAANGQVTYFDDFRAHPVDATMTSYVYNEWGELSYILDANNIYTKYEYDAMGRLIKTYRESFDYAETLTSHIVYKYNPPKANLIAQLALLQTSYREGIQGMLNVNANYTHPDLQYEVYIDNSRVLTSDTPYISWTPLSRGSKIVYGVVRDTQTGIFVRTEEKTINVHGPCPPYGTYLYDHCRYTDTSFCTFYIVGVYADGNCGTYDGVATGDVTTCPVSIDCE
ncbi:hypothetical protein FNH22_10710 [Fulvivirga sp. M361]|uniref:hypothetical protein n=1 Tax=Fulvivirga sp. M361 TaxID=2594266 RepID=UPI001179FE88|nr:hypothetical protein [Fulvivirga sp. M361]TRX59608.1 hypothetical protein FNH22_10710 [Fulvivirga sp. M361]